MLAASANSCPNASLIRSDSSSGARRPRAGFRRASPASRVDRARRRGSRLLPPAAPRGRRIQALPGRARSPPGYIRSVPKLTARSVVASTRSTPWATSARASSRRPARIHVRQTFSRTWRSTIICSRLVEAPGAFGGFDSGVDVEHVGQRHQRPERQRVARLLRRRVRGLVHGQDVCALKLPAIRDEVRSAAPPPRRWRTDRGSGCCDVREIRCPRPRPTRRSRRTPPSGDGGRFAVGREGGCALERFRLGCDPAGAAGRRRQPTRAPPRPLRSGRRRWRPRDATRAGRARSWSQRASRARSSGRQRARPGTPRNARADARDSSRSGTSNPTAVAATTAPSPSSTLEGVS